MRSGARIVVSALALTALPWSAWAQSAGDSPRQIYDRAAAEYDAKDYAKAASDFAHADELAPNEVTLMYALEAAIRAHDAPLGMQLVARVEQRSASASRVRARADEARKSFAKEVGQITVTCPAPITFCKATVDTQLVTIATPTFVTIGAHAVHIEADGAPSDQTVQVEAEKTTEVAPPAPAAAPPPAPAPPPVAPVPVVEPPPPRPAPKHDARLSPTWFWIAGGVTVLLAGGAILSGLDTNAKYDDYAASRTNHDRNTGRSAQLRTNILWGATALGGIGTGVLGIFFVGWHSGPAVTASAKF